MRSQILTMKKSSQSEHSKCSILVNELIRRFEVLDCNIGIDEKVQIIDHYTQQLINSGKRFDRKWSKGYEKKRRKEKEKKQQI